MRDLILRHRLRTAHDTMQLDCIFARLLGRLDHVEAVTIIEDLTGAVVHVPDDCSCQPWGERRK